MQTAVKVSSMSYALFLDDERNPPDDGSHWVIARSSTEALGLISQLGWPNYVSFDHDLGPGDTAMVFIHAVITQLLNDSADLPFRWTVHSQNPVGRDNIVALLENFERTRIQP